MLESVALCGDSVHATLAARSLPVTSRQTSTTIGRRGSCSMTSSVIGGRLRSTLRARYALGRARAGAFAMPSSGSRVRPYSPAGFSRSSSATGNQPATCSTPSMSACRSPRLTGSPTRSSIAAPSTRRTSTRRLRRVPGGSRRPREPAGAERPRSRRGDRVAAVRPDRRARQGI